MKLKEISFVMENCEAITISGKYIGHFIVDKIEKGIYRLASNHIGKTKTANRIVIEIHKNANREDYVFGSENLGKQFTFDRLKQGDITQIEFILEDEEGNEKFHFFGLFLSQDTIHIYREICNVYFGLKHMICMYLRSSNCHFWQLLNR